VSQSNYIAGDALRDYAPGNARKARAAPATNAHLSTGCGSQRQPHDEGAGTNQLACCRVGGVLIRSGESGRGVTLVPPSVASHFV
jgi:hypothetical protein